MSCQLGTDVSHAPWGKSVHSVSHKADREQRESRARVIIKSTGSGKTSSGLYTNGKDKKSTLDSGHSNQNQMVRPFPIRVVQPWSQSFPHQQRVAAHVQRVTKPFPWHASPLTGKNDDFNLENSSLITDSPYSFLIMLVLAWWTIREMYINSPSLHVTIMTLTNYTELVSLHVFHLITQPLYHLQKKWAPREPVGDRLPSRSTCRTAFIPESVWRSTDFYDWGSWWHLTPLGAENSYRHLFPCGIFTSSLWVCIPLMSTWSGHLSNTRQLTQDLIEVHDMAILHSALSKLKTGENKQWRWLYCKQCHLGPT